MNTDDIEKETVESIEAIESIFSMLTSEDKARSYDRFHALTLMALRIRQLLNELAGRIIEAAQFRRTIRKVNKLCEEKDAIIAELRKGSPTK